MSDFFDLSAFEFNEKLEKQSQDWQKDIEDRMSELESIYKKFQAEQSLYTTQMKQEKILEIEIKEKEVAALQQKRFGPNGELFKKRQELLQPIMNKMIEEIKIEKDKTPKTTPNKPILDVDHKNGKKKYYIYIYIDLFSFHLFIYKIK